MNICRRGFLATLLSAAIVPKPKPDPYAPRFLIFGDPSIVPQRKLKILPPRTTTWSVYNKKWMCDLELVYK